MIQDKLKKVKIFQALSDLELQKIINISVVKKFSAFLIFRLTPTYAQYGG